jgi:hypothetical protein
MSSKHDKVLFAHRDPTAAGLASGGFLPNRSNSAAAPGAGPSKPFAPRRYRTDFRR